MLIRIAVRSGLNCTSSGTWMYQPRITSTQTPTAMPARSSTDLPARAGHSRWAVRNPCEVAALVITLLRGAVMQISGSD